VQAFAKHGPFVKVTVGPELEIEAASRWVVEGTPPVDEARVMGMLRITIAETPTEQKWTVEGRLVHPWISELKSTWTKTKTARRERKCVVDLTGVTFIDKSGENVLAELSKQGAELIATGCYTRHVVDNIERKKSNRQL
jgi:RecB family endonuclease NucS